MGSKNAEGVESRSFVRATWSLGLGHLGPGPGRERASSGTRSDRYKAAGARLGGPAGTGSGPKAALRPRSQCLQRVRDDLVDPQSFDACKSLHRQSAETP